VIAIVVAVVGVMSTVMGAALAAFVAARADQRREAALERQHVREEQKQNRAQLNELRVEHQRWRRERRQTAYLGLLEALGAADRENQALFRELRARRSPVPVDETRIAEIRVKFKNSESAALVVILEGPETIAEAAQHLVDLMASLVQDVREYAEAAAADGHTDQGNAVHEAGVNFMAERRAFLDMARCALDEVTEYGQGLPDTR
jgi:hypothetical protein